MIALVVDGRPVEVPEGTTVLRAASRLGIVVPTLCHLEGHACSGACMVCVVEDRVSGRLLPACSARAEAGMQIETQSELTRGARRTALELLLSDHAGDCQAPCSRACPLHVDLPAVLDHLQQGETVAAWRLLRQATVLPATAARLCRGGCRKACRRRALDSPVEVALVHARLAAWGLASRARTAQVERSGLRVAIVGASARGLAAADALAARGHSCTLFGDRFAPWQALRQALAEDRTGEAGLVREIDAVAAGLDLRLGVRVGLDQTVAETARGFDLTLVASDDAGLRIDAHHANVAGAGDPAAADPLAELARGCELGTSAHCRLVGKQDAHPLAACVPLAAPERDELLALHANRQQRLADRRCRVDSADAVRREDEGLVSEARRCLGCGCESAASCALRRLAAEHHAEPRRFAGKRRRVARTLEHPLVRHQPGKCILCGRCVRLAEEADEALGLAVCGRGFETRVLVPFERPLAEALARSALACADACPTGALRLRSEAGSG